MSKSKYNAKINSSLIYLHKNKLWVNPDHIVTIVPRSELVDGKFVDFTDSWRVVLSIDDWGFHIGDDDMETLGIFLEVEDE